jgi:hypothetical protein
MGSVYPDKLTRSLNSSMYASTFHLPWKYWSDSSHMSAVVASFSGKNAAMNSSLNSSQDVKHIFLLEFDRHFCVHYIPLFSSPRYELT